MTTPITPSQKAEINQQRKAERLWKRAHELVDFTEEKAALDRLIEMTRFKTAAERQLILQQKGE
jgi:Zn-dependent M32 family carboxypeptidase